MTASRSTRRTTSWRNPTAASGSPIRPTAVRSPKVTRTTPAARRGAKARIADQHLPLGSERQARGGDPGGALPDPSGICFSPDYKTLYVISTGKGPGDTGPGGDRNIYAFDVQGTKVGNKRLFTDMTV